MWGTCLVLQEHELDLVITVPTGNMMFTDLLNPALQLQLIHTEGGVRAAKRAHSQGPVHTASAAPVTVPVPYIVVVVALPGGPNTKTPTWQHCWTTSTAWRITLAWALTGYVFLEVFSFFTFPSHTSSHVVHCHGTLRFYLDT